jgi:putative endonuclease
MGILNRVLGTKGEREAESVLKRAGYKIVERNFHSTFGEIDLIAMDNDTLVFIEVKTRSSEAYGTGSEAVDARKQGRIVKSSMEYLSRKWQGPEPHVRYDVVSVMLKEEDGGGFSCEIIKDAFGADGVL